MKNLSNLLEDVVSYFENKYGFTETFEVNGFNCNRHLGKIHVLKLKKQPERAELNLVLTESSLRLLWSKPNNSSERLSGEIIGVEIDIFGLQGVLIINPTSIVRGSSCFMFKVEDKILWKLKIEFLSKLNELYYSGNYNLKPEKDFV